MSAWGVSRIGSMAVGSAFCTLGLFIAIETVTKIPAGPSYAAVGPRAFPGLIGVGLMWVGLLLARQAFKGASSPINEDRYDWSALFWVVGTLAAQILVLSLIGWIPAATLVFVGVARGFGSRAWTRNALIGVGLGVGTFLLFNQVLGLDLPTGQVVDAIRGR